MSQDRFKDRLEEYVAQQLSAVMVQDLEQHLAICPECREQLKTVRLTRAIVKACRLEEAPVPAAGFARRVLRAIEQRREAYLFWNPLRLVAARFVPAVAALALGIALFAYLEITKTLNAQGNPPEPLLESTLEQSPDWGQADVAVYSDKFSQDQDQILTTLLEGKSNPAAVRGKEPQ